MEATTKLLPVTTPPPTPPGWYPDPQGGPNLRWFNGTQWTDQYQAQAPTQQFATPPPPAGVSSERRFTIHYGFVLLAVFSFLGTVIPSLFWFVGAANVEIDPVATQSEIDGANAATGVMSFFGIGWLLWGGMWTIIWTAFAIQHTLKSKRSP